MPSSSSLAFASTIDYDDEPKEQEECEEESDYDNLCSGHSGVNGKPFCDMFNATKGLTYFLMLQKKAVMIEQPILYPSAKNLMT